MLRIVFALPLLAMPLAAAAQPAAKADQGRWSLARAPGSCTLHATSSQGTMLSISGSAGDEKIGFLIQNKEWAALRDGQHYDLKVDFVGVHAWPVQATARRATEGGGPGFFFTVEPGDRPGGGGAFLDALASAKGMAISRDGAAVDSLSLAGSREAVGALARCMADLWASPPGADEISKQPFEAPAVPTT